MIGGVLLAEHLGIALERIGRVVDAGAAAAALLGVAQVGGRIGAQEKLRIAGGGGLAQGQAVQLAFGHRQAIHVGPQSPLEQGVAVDVQVVGGDGGCQVARPRLHELHRLSGGDVLQHHLQGWMPLQQGLEVALDEHRFAIKDVNGGIGHLPVNQQGHADALHAGEHWRDVRQIAHARVGVGGGTGRVELRCGEHSRCKAPLQLIGCDCFGEIGRHQRREPGRGLRSGAALQRLQDAIAVGAGLRHCGDRWFEVGHHDRPRKLGCGVPHHGLQQSFIAQMHVPIVGRADREGLPGG